MNKKFLITSALPYANGPLHFGHIAGAYLPGDCFARFQRCMGNEVLFISGSDEYGVAITMSAEIAKRSPKEHVDFYHKINQDLFQKLHFSFDHFSRTTWEGHLAPSQQFFLDLLANGFIEERVTHQLYSEQDHRFLADRYVVGTCPSCGFEQARGDECPKCGASYEATDLLHPRSKISLAPLVLKPTKHWFLLLDQFKEKLTEWLKTKKWKPNVLKFIQGFVKDLRPRAITRDSHWGVPVPLPNSEGKVLYVWFDAPVGYISATKEWALLQGNKEKWKDFWFDPNTELVHFIGKDNIPFHAAIFPAMIMGQNLPLKLVDELPANEFYNLEGRQFSKSDGWFIDLEDFFKKYSSDQIRYVIASNAPESSDSEFTWKDFQLKCNVDLVGKLGNLVNRIFVFAHKNCSGQVPPCVLKEDDVAFMKEIERIFQEGILAYQTFHLRKASQLIMEMAQAGNVYFDSKRPWKLAKEAGGKEAMFTTIASSLECIKKIALLSYPIMPNTAEEIWQLLGKQTPLKNCFFIDENASHLPENQCLKQPKILFQKIEDAQIEEEIAKLHVMKGGIG